MRILPLRQTDSQGALAFVQPGTVKISASQAALIVRECTHELQKKIRPPDRPEWVAHQQTLAAIMKRREWLENTQIWFARMPDGKLWIADGHNRLLAQAMSTQSLAWDFKFIDVKDDAEFRTLFWRFNTNSRGRTDRQILAASASAETIGIPKTALKALYQAVPYIAQNFKNFGNSVRDPLTTRIIDRRLDDVNKYAPEARKYSDCAELAQKVLKRKLYNGGTTAVAIITFRYQPVKADEFWRGVAENDGLKKGDPRRTLINDLLSRPLNSGAAEQTCAVPALAWNAFFEDRDLNTIKIYPGRAVSISGTPYEE